MDASHAELPGGGYDVASPSWQLQDDVPVHRHRAADGPLPRSVHHVSAQDGRGRYGGRAAGAAHPPASALCADGAGDHRRAAGSRQIDVHGDHNERIRRAARKLAVARHRPGRKPDGQARGNHHHGRHREPARPRLPRGAGAHQGRLHGAAKRPQPGRAHHQHRNAMAQGGRVLHHAGGGKI